MTRVENTFSLVMTQDQKATSYIIQTMERSLSIKMPSLVKKKHGIGVLIKVTMILLLTIKYKNKQEEDCTNISKNTTNISKNIYAKI